MAPVTHALVSWWTANVLPIKRRDRFIVFLAGILPDLDGLTILYSQQAYAEYHHIVCHNLLAGLVWTALVALLARERARCSVLAILNWHLHLACDYFGSAGPNNDVWVLPYLYPLLGGYAHGDFVGPAWYWNAWQWELPAWPNLLVTALAAVGWVYIAIRLDRTFLEFVWPRMDLELCAMFRRWFGGKASEDWPQREGRLVWRSFLAATSLVLLACVAAAARTEARGSHRAMEQPRIHNSH